MSKPATPLAQISRDPVLRKALASSACNGDAFAVATDITPALIAAYARWLDLERSLLMDERPPRLRPRFQPQPLSALVGWSQADIADLRAREQRAIDADLNLERIFDRLGGTFQARAGYRDGAPRSAESRVDRFYLSPDMAIISPPASTRAALVLSAVGCDWRAPC